jgi:ribosome-binding protein aMBF1 (putative translation factor)
MIRDYENGRGIPNSQLIRCFESILGGSLRWDRRFVIMNLIHQSE